MKKRKAWKIVLCVVLVVLVALGGTVLYLMTGLSPAETVQRQVDTSDGVLRIGILSDLQLTPEGQGETYDMHYQKALELFKAQGVNVILNAGDFTDTATEEAYQNQKRIFDSVYSEAERESIVLCSIMGNHDYWLPMFVDCWEIPFTRVMQSRFCEYTYSQSPWTHTVVNGYHFIAASPNSGDMDSTSYDDELLMWMREQIEAAVADDPALPVFVMTHFSPENTVAMSEDNTFQNLDALYREYPQVVSIGAHSHAPLMDERAIWQGDYTAINTQSVSYTTLPETENAVVHDDGAFIENNPMVMILSVDGAQLSIQRYSVLTGEAQKAPWVIDLPVDKDEFRYTEARAEESAAPTWADGFSVSAEGVSFTDDEGAEVRGCRITFPAALHADAVKSYRAVFTQNGSPVTFTFGETTYDSLTLISDYALPAAQRSDTMRFTLPAEKYASVLPAGTYTVTLYATDAYGNESAPQTAEIEIAY